MLLLAALLLGQYLTIYIHLYGRYRLSYHEAISALCGSLDSSVFRGLRLIQELQHVLSKLLYLAVKQSSSSECGYVQWMFSPHCSWMLDPGRLFGL